MSRAVRPSVSSVPSGGQELVAMASANVVGSFFKAYPASGSLSRTAVVQSVGAKTRMHLIPAVVVVMLVLVAITPLLYTLPNAILASVVSERNLLT